MDMMKVEKDMADSLDVWGEEVTGGTWARDGEHDTGRRALNRDVYY
jgi:hypothetical protein